MTRTVALLVGREPADRYSLYRGYADAVWAAGGTPLVLVPPTSPAGVERYVAAALRCDAICATGGGDVDPAHYGLDLGGSLMDVDRLRDEAELAAVRAAIAGERAVLGVCRGVQLVTVACGGSLHPDLPIAGYTGHWQEERQFEPVHTVSADPGSLAVRALGGTAMVNSIHHQAVRDPGPSLRATAWSDDGLIEAVEAPGVLGVQWHPERLYPSDARHLAPFTWLVAA